MNRLDDPLLSAGSSSALGFPAASVPLEKFDFKFSSGGAHISRTIRASYIAENKPMTGCREIGLVLSTSLYETPLATGHFAIETHVVEIASASVKMFFRSTSRFSAVGTAQYFRIGPQASPSPSS
jgi:hypothetical protein